MPCHKSTDCARIFTMKQRYYARLSLMKLFEEMMDRETHSLLLTMSKRTHKSDIRSCSLLRRVYVTV